jgi:hypothetical protein
MMRTFLRSIIPCAALLCLTVGWASTAANGILSDVSDQAVFVTLVVVSGQAAGWIVARRRPQFWTGIVIELTAFVPLVAARNAALGHLVPKIAVLWLATALVPAVGLLTIPDLIGSRMARWVLAIGVAGTASLSYPIVALAGGRANASAAWWHTTNPFIPVDEGAQRLFAVYAAIVAVVLLFVVASVVRSRLRMSRSARSIGRPVVIAGVVWAAVTIASQLASVADPIWALSRTLDDLTPEASLLLRIAPGLALAVLIGTAVWVELVAPRLTTTRPGTLHGNERIEGISTYLTSALADPSVQVVFWSAQDGTWRDETGRSTAVPFDDPERAVTIVTREGERVGAFVHDAAWASQPDTLAIVSLAGALMLDNARLTALANARLDDARRLTARLVSAADDSREQVRHELTTGSLRELEQLAADLDHDDAAIADRLQVLAADVRRLSHGVFPSALAEHGLAAVLTDATEVTTRRYPPATEVTVYLAAVGDPAARIHENDNDLIIELSRPPANPQVVDRVAALGGRIDGTVVRLPVLDVSLPADNTVGATT